MTSEQNKTVVISDVHMGDGAKFSWFLPPYSEALAAMLTGVATDPTVGELVILGDLFDLWLYPVDVVPLTVAQIATANPLCTQALQKCVACLPNVYYIAGNHDMGVLAHDLAPFNCGSKSMQWITPEAYSAKYKNRRHLEHGHAADMFNAPDPAADTVAGYPLGYFITRLVASAANQSAVWDALKNLLQAISGTQRALGPAVLAVPTASEFLVQAIISLLELLAEVPDTARIRFADSSIDNKYTVGDIKRHYGSLLPTWMQRYPDPSQLLSAMLSGFLSKGLDWYAKLLLSVPLPPKVLVMGHTHHADMEGAYDNSGCWCVPSALGHGDPAPSYVVIVGDTATVLHWASQSPNAT